jgi:hypothetical protein
MRDRDKKRRTHEKTGAGSEATRGTEEAGQPSRTHESGYGGRAAQPKTSSDQREPLDPSGKKEPD